LCLSLIFVVSRVLLVLCVINAWGLKLIKMLLNYINVRNTLVTVLYLFVEMQDVVER
jgi:hypothetical protein